MILERSDVILWSLLMRKIISVLLITVGLMLISAVRADGFSATLNTSLPSFSASLGLNYTLEVIPNLVVGGGISGFYGQPYPQIGFQFGALYDQKLMLNADTTLEFYAGARVAGLVVPYLPFSAWFEPNAGVSAEFVVADKTKVLGNLDLVFYVPLTETAVFEFSGNLGVGLKYALFENLELSAILSGSYFVAGSVLSQTNFSILTKILFTVFPEVKLGTSFDVSFSSTGKTNFSISIFGWLTENPGTLGTPDTRLP